MFSCIKQKNCAIYILYPKIKNSKEIGDFEEVFLQKQWRKHTSSFVMIFLLSGLETRKLPGYKATDAPKMQQCIIIGNSLGRRERTMWKHQCSFGPFGPFLCKLQKCFLKKGSSFNYNAIAIQVCQLIFFHERSTCT